MVSKCGPRYCLDELACASGVPLPQPTRYAASAYLAGRLGGQCHRARCARRADFVIAGRVSARVYVLHVSPGAKPDWPSQNLHVLCASRSTLVATASNPVLSVFQLLSLILFLHFQATPRPLFGIPRPPDHAGFCALRPSGTACCSS